MKQHGFSLLEMTIVLLALSLMLNGLISPLSARMLQSQLRQTDQQLQHALEALMGFALLQNRLPCPDTDNDGKENNTACDQEGNLPWADLGIIGTDPWNQTLRYRVAPAFTSATLPPAINLSATSTLQIKRKDGTALTVTDSVVAAVIFSTGKNITRDDDNADGDRTYISDDLVEDQANPSNTFDDRLTWLSKNELFYRMVTANIVYP
jgi:prepilin-type N-terminal cleavage/methylation domain-containing protein